MGSLGFEGCAKVAMVTAPGTPSPRPGARGASLARRTMRKRRAVMAGKAMVVAASDRGKSPIWRQSLPCCASSTGR